MVRVKDTKTFIEKARIKHGDKYNYDKTVYNGAANKLTVTCPEHGDFEIQASKHVNISAGCQECSRLSMAEKLTNHNINERKKSFITQAIKMWDNKYDYSEMGFQNHMKKVKIICPEHGMFYTTPNRHLTSGYSGCSGCSSFKREEKFIRAAKDKYGDVYDYSEVEYISMHIKVKIYCTEHKEYFYIAPKHHLHSEGCCIKCSRDQRNRNKQESLIHMAMKTHSGKYDYSLVEYDNRLDKVTIICPHHGEFKQPLYIHAKGSGCPGCNLGGYRGNPNSAYGIAGYYGTENPANLYLIEVGEDFVKVGVTKDVNSRLSDIKKETQSEVKIIGTWRGKAKDLFKVEQEILHRSNFEKYEPETKFVGSTECFQLNEKNNIKEYIENKITKEINHEQSKV